ncbi:chemotaxis protein CheC (plasmid) [Pontibacillus sp. ALD_SL1]|uniref:chemotaxis protein CheC n=1 Tax=Pontibacillus sp. ALD_SL1 TaxID=2777185 RepID=UPI001A9744C0|nr:chemotaxis protein CheC [Pontibacillus sp. ALD_SL1]QST03041.1 chemotaxis protein CheC [Pontibacillus sp. ALD_SL1]
MNLSQMDLGIIGEIGNISVGGAASSLSNFVHKMVNISVPDTKIMTFEELKKRFPSTVVYAKIDYDNGMEGSNLLLMHKEEALELSKIIVKEKLGEEIEGWNAYAENVLAEVFNIMVGHMSSVMGEMFHQSIKVKVPTTYDELHRLDVFPNDEKLVSVWFEVRIENAFKLKVVKLLNSEQAHYMVNKIKEDHHL